MIKIHQTCNSWKFKIEKMKGCAHVRIVETSVSKSQYILFPNTRRGYGNIKYKMAEFD